MSMADPSSHADHPVSLHHQHQDQPQETPPAPHHYDRKQSRTSHDAEDAAPDLPPQDSQPQSQSQSSPQQQPEHYTYGSFTDIERQGQSQSQLPAPQPQALWPLFFALVVLGCFLVFFILPLI